MVVPLTAANTFTMSVSSIYIYVLKQIYDVKGWLVPATEELHNHSNPHVFIQVYLLHKNYNFDNPFIDLPEIVIA